VDFVFALEKLEPGAFGKAQIVIESLDFCILIADP
jgi:hypothetical protein